MARWISVVVTVAVFSCTRGAESLSATPPAPPIQKGECDQVDATKLEPLVECYYRAKRGPSMWALLSTVAKADEKDDVGWVKLDSSDREISEVRVTKQEAIAGASFAAVSYTLRTRQADGGLGCSTTDTRTWVREAEGWRRHGGTNKFSEVANGKFKAGDYSGAVESAEEWLKIDPLSVEAYKRLGAAIGRGAKGKNKDDVVRAAMSIDPRNSTALSLTIALTSDPDVNESYLRQFKPDDCRLPSAVENVALSLIGAGRPRDALKLLDERAGLGAFIRLRISALSNLHRTREVPALLTAPVVAEIRKELESSDASFAAIWAGSIAAALIEAGDKTKAREWIDYGLLRDPSDARLPKLLRASK